MQIHWKTMEALSSLNSISLHLNYSKCIAFCTPHTPTRKILESFHLGCRLWASLCKSSLGLSTHTPNRFVNWSIVAFGILVGKTVSHTWKSSQLSLRKGFHSIKKKSYIILITQTTKRYMIYLDLLWVLILWVLTEKCLCRRLLV